MYVLVGILQSVGMYYIYYITLLVAIVVIASHGQSKELLFDSWAKIGRRTSIMVFSVSFNIAGNSLMLVKRAYSTTNMLLQ